jgi:hypothetical protein
MYVTMSISTGLYPNLDLWTANKLQLQSIMKSSQKLSFMHVYSIVFSKLFSNNYVLNEFY